MIRSEQEAANKKWLAGIFGEDEAILDDGIGRYCEHRYVGGPPPKRIYKMQIAHEGRARKTGVPWDVVDLRTVYAKYNGLCGICQRPVGLDVFTIDHIVPISRGGAHVFDNLQPAHFACNTQKGNR